MKHRQTICRKLLFPPLWLIIVLSVFSAVALAAVFVNGWDDTPFAYVTYAVAFYSLTAVCLACRKTFPGYYKSIKSKVYENQYANRYFTDAAFKTHISLYLSLGINLLYVATNAVSAFLYKTNWFGVFAVYYAIMAAMRFLLLMYIRRNGLRKNRMGELKRSRACAFILITVNLALSGAVMMMVYNNRGFEYQGIMIYVMAMYTFWITTTAIIDLIKYRKYNSPVMSTSKAIKFAASMVSILFLETAMLSQFGEEMSAEAKEIFIMAIGGGIVVIVAVMSVYIIVHATKEIKKLKNNNS